MNKLEILTKLKEVMEKTKEEYSIKSFSEKINCNYKDIEDLIKEYNAEDLEDLYFKTRSFVRLEKIKKYNKLLQAYFKRTA
jgi:hypothetical protein